ncbi:TIGR03016 family PEP-CTERM system-associated outer membrane protein [Parahaliea mediterranea]|uniref:TIGR03016 family PEP-CTERM system-associated outer membrane protein n=1 Tax=Parahaliea mediterranea TaxID=651086 RepID=UPI000E2FD881|nr:TIGR03016 family PEP-CTERM system-associated outer membrane protein [Parahaliea mediterranea]
MSRRLSRIGRLAQPGALTAVGLAVFCAPTMSAEWTRGAGITAGAIYTDNVCLRSNDKLDDTIGIVTPNVRLKGEGARASMDLYAAAQFNTMENSGVDCGVVGADNISPAPRIRFNGDAELLSNWLYVDATAFADQNRINPFAAGGEDALDGRGNLNTSYQYAISPYIARRLGDDAALLVRYRYSEEYNTEDALNDNQLQQAQFDLGTVPELARFSIGVSGTYSEIDYDERFGGEEPFNNQLSSAQVRAAFQLNRSVQFNGYIGEEWNDYVSVFQDDEGSFWDVGLRWTPNTRVTVDLGTGERFFGETPRASIAYRHKRSTLRASYQRTLTYDRTLRGTDPFADDVDELIDGGLPDDQGIIGEGGEETTITNSPILDERFLLTYRFTTRRTTFSVNASHSEQTRSEDGLEDTFIAAGIGVERALGARLSSYVRLTWTRREADQRRDLLAPDSDNGRATLGFDYQLGQRTSVGLAYQYNERQSDNPLDEYEENRVLLQFRYQI